MQSLVNVERTHRNRKHPQLWMAVLRTAVLHTAAPYMVGSLSPPFERLEILINLLLVIATRRDRGVGQ